MQMGIPKFYEIFDSLLHRSQIPRGTQLQVGDVIQVEILRVEVERGRIGLGWIENGKRES